MSEVKNEGLEVVARVSGSGVNWLAGSGLMNGDRLCRHSEALAGYAVRDARIAELEAQIKVLQSDANSWQSGYDEGRRMGAKHCIGTVNQLRTELAAMREQVSVQLVIGSTYESSRGFGRLLYLGETHDIDGWLPTFRMTDGTKKFYRHDKMHSALVEFAAPVAKQVVMPEREGGHAQKSFWAGFEVARMRPDESNIRAAWNEFKSSDQFTRLNAADQDGDV